jgi:hypothetical protein
MRETGRVFCRPVFCRPTGRFVTPERRSGALGLAVWGPKYPCRPRDDPVGSVATPCSSLTRRCFHSARHQAISGPRHVISPPIFLGDFAAPPVHLIPNATIHYTCSRHSEGACDRGISSILAGTIAVEPPFFTPLPLSSERLTPRAFGHCVPSTSLGVPVLPLRYQKMYNDLSQMVLEHKRTRLGGTEVLMTEPFHSPLGFPDNRTSPQEVRKRAHEP